MRVCLFTDTLGDVNGVSRFIRNVAEQSLRRGGACDVQVITSTRFACPEAPNVHNVRPLWATAMPGYPQLELAVPPAARVWRLASALAPDAVHVSTPGPVGAIGRLFARRRGLPLLGTYHTDFPAYVEHLFEDPVLTWVCDRAMRAFYRPFDRVFTRSADYGEALVRLGVARERVVRLLPGIDTGVFHTRFRPRDAEGEPGGAGVARFWGRYPGVEPGAVKALYVGRVSVEKNLPMLVGVWRATLERLRAAGGAAEARGEGAAQLVVVGDGPYRERMEAETREFAKAGEPTPAVFLGFRHGEELSAIYAASDLFVFPSMTDTLGQVVMEAQSAGLPVVVTDRGGPSEVVRDAGGSDEGTGYVLPADDPPPYVRWSATLVRLITDAGLRARLGTAAHASIQPLSIDKSFDHFWSVHAGEVAARRVALGPEAGVGGAGPAQRAGAAAPAIGLSGP